MTTIPEDTLVHEWPVFKRYTLDESVFSLKERELVGPAVAAAQKCQCCQAFHRGDARRCVLPLVGHRE